MLGKKRPSCFHELTEQKVVFWRSLCSVLESFSWFWHGILMVMSVSLFFVVCWIWNIIKKSSHHLMPLKYWSFPFDGCMWNRKRKNMHSNECPFSYPNQASCLSFSVWQRLAYLLSRSCLSLVAWPLKQACLEVVSSEGDQGLVNSKTVSVTTSPSNLTPRWDNCSGHLSSTVLFHHGMFVIKGLVASGTFILVKHPIFCFF